MEEIRSQWLYHLTELPRIFYDADIEKNLSEGWLLAEDYFKLSDETKQKTEGLCEDNGVIKKTKTKKKARKGSI